MIPSERPYLAEFVKPPKDVVAEVILNGQLTQHATDQNLLRMLDQSFILEHFLLFGLGGVNGNNEVHKRPQPPSMRRGLLYRIIQNNRPIFDEYGLAYGEIGAKGTGISACGLSYYAQNYVEMSPLEIEAKIIRDSDPAGLFGLAHSIQEMNVSNLFAENGGRNGRVMAIMVLDPKRLKEWFFSSYRNHEHKYPLPAILNKVERNNDIPAICVRLMGAERYEDYKGSYYNRDKPVSEGLFTRRRMVQRAVHIIRAEAEGIGREAFARRYCLDNSFSLESMVDQIATSHYLLLDDRMGDFLYVKLLRSFKKWNLSVLDKMSESNFEGKLTLFAKRQDVDLAGFLYDWELSVPGSAQYRNAHSVSHLNQYTIADF